MGNKFLADPEDFMFEAPEGAGGGAGATSSKAVSTNPSSSASGASGVPLTAPGSLPGATPTPVKKETDSRPPWEMFQDQEYLAKTLYGEARGEGAEGMRKVGSTILSRVSKGTWGKKIKDVVTYPWQYSSWNQSDPNRKLLDTVDSKNPQYLQAMRIAAELLQKGPDPSIGGATHFYSPAGMKDGKEPDWVASMTHTGDVGGHKFYR